MRDVEVEVGSTNISSWTSVKGFLSLCAVQNHVCPLCAERLVDTCPLQQPVHMHKDCRRPLDS